MFAILALALFSPNVPTEELKLRIENRRKMAVTDSARKFNAASSLHIAISNAYARELAASLRGDDEDDEPMHKVKLD